MAGRGVDSLNSVGAVDSVGADSLQSIGVISLDSGGAILWRSCGILSVGR